MWKTRAPDVGGHQVGAVGGLQYNLQQVTRGQSQDGPTVRLQVPYGRKFMVDMRYGIQVGGIHQVMVLADAVAMFIDRTDLRSQAEAHIDVSRFDTGNAWIGWWILQRKKAVAIGLQLFF
ncbi:hypothetical protein [Fodinibius salsisoli]|uniref:Uncharacterized protein n=1 Tax=Fodinibius salsisoli TaxID=2820877 RepID=A0ABT3PSE1_9BACT|nr:hypothetical protein [Fodinibius salsisoli]MCW9708789.1 hypothetical protein [Fodinibius salsisoli]